ncbi:MAG: hypothetical protein GY703_18800 [Gammaproteobacteria bacterium]|nr:hypothetical protein [Gammaproteobacteria bacterium]
MYKVTSELFFRPAPIQKHSMTIPADLYNRCRLLLSRCEGGYLFVAIRSMQYLAVIDSQEVVFVDSQAYAVHDGEGGRIIMVSWCFHEANSRDSLTAPVPIEVLHHQPGLEGEANRLLSEFRKALIELKQRGHELDAAPAGRRVVMFPSR